MWQPLPTFPHILLYIWGSISSIYRVYQCFSITTSPGLGPGPLALLHFTYKMQQRKKYEIAKQIKKNRRDFCNKEIERRARNISNGPRQAESFDWKMFKGYEVSTDELSLGCPLFLCLDSCLFHFYLFAVCCQCCQVKIRRSRQRFLREMYTEEISSRGNLICSSSSDTFPLV